MRRHRKTNMDSSVTRYPLDARRSSGFSLVETLTTVAIIIIISAMTFGVFGSFNKQKSLEKEGSSLLLLLERARFLTLASKDSSQYGIHFASTTETLFKGSIYSASDPSNVNSALSPNTQISAVNLTGGGVNVIFERLTGKTAQTGTVTISLKDDPSSTRNITIYKTGLAE